MNKSYNFISRFTGTITFLLIFVSIIFYAYSTGITGETRKNGSGCYCHSEQPSPNVHVEIVGPAQLEVNATAVYQVKITGGPALSGGTNIAAYYGTLNASSPLQKIGDELTHELPQPFSGDTLIFTFNYTAPSSPIFDTIYANGNSVNFNGQNTGDEWNFAPNKIVEIVNPVPVELVNFTSAQDKNNIVLTWITSSEINNYGFEIQKSFSDKELSDWKTIGFVRGNGNSLEVKNYSFSDMNLIPGKYKYRLKQVDFDGSFSIYELQNEIIINTPEDFTLHQNYPNPFNPSTTIKFQIPAGSFVDLKIYNSLGSEVKTIVNEFKEEGIHSVNFSADDLSSGIYYYELRADNFKSVKKMILTK
jgi:hypothetical protein